MNFLEKLRNESEGKRKRFAVIWASILTLIIFLVWFSVFQLNFGVSKKAGSASSPLEALDSVFGSFGKDVYTAVGDIKDKVSGATNDIFPSDNSSPDSSVDNQTPVDNSGTPTGETSATPPDSEPLPFR
ncbi:MAG: hypothetical protein WC250_00815 [Candidatus Paceibacterota bacterium]|jgi:hypothetical protein